MREFGVDAFGKPGLLLPPMESFLDEYLADAAALDATLFVLAQVGDMPVKHPAGKRQVQFLPIIGKRQGDHLGTMFERIGGRLARTRQVVETGQRVFVEAFHSVAGGLRMQAQAHGKCWHAMSLSGEPDDLGAALAEQELYASVRDAR